MPTNSSWKTFVCWFFISTLFISALQVTIAGYQADENSWFSIISLLIAEEESEESETEEKEGKEGVKEWLPFHQHLKTVASTQMVVENQCTLQCQGVLREVLSPPPELS